MHIDFITLFPSSVLGAVRHSMLLRAEHDEIVTFNAVDPREFTTDRHRTVDDKPFGGGPGMLMKAAPIWEAFQSLDVSSDAAIVVPDPTGPLYTQKDARNLATYERIVFICGHYEGIDERVISLLATHRFSIGDYVLTGGELPAAVIADSVVRLLPGVLGCQDSLEIDSHSQGLLSAPQYTRPEVFEGTKVPDALRSGNHQSVETWKRQASLKLTRSSRPDLFCQASLEKRDLDLLSS